MCLGAHFWPKKACPSTPWSTWPTSPTVSCRLAAGKRRCCGGASRVRVGRVCDYLEERTHPACIPTTPCLALATAPTRVSHAAEWHRRLYNARTPRPWSRRMNWPPLRAARAGDGATRGRTSRKRFSIVDARRPASATSKSSSASSRSTVSTARRGCVAGVRRWPGASRCAGRPPPITPSACWPSCGVVARPCRCASPPPDAAGFAWAQCAP